MVSSWNSEREEGACPSSSLFDGAGRQTIATNSGTWVASHERYTPVDLVGSCNNHVFFCHYITGQESCLGVLCIPCTGKQINDFKGTNIYAKLFKID